jgi:hypothetical protein
MAGTGWLSAHVFLTFINGAAVSGRPIVVSFKST